VAEETPGDARYEAFLEAIQRRVCTVCLDQKDDGSCGLRGRTCAIEKHLPDVVRVVTAIDSDHMDDYVAALESEVCGSCSEQDASGHCAIREKGRCALHAYLSLVVDAIQDVREAEGRPPLRASAPLS
jgi:hypothetical protein